MALEIERKFLCSLTKEQATDLAFDSRHIRSVYLQNTPTFSVRVVRDTDRRGLNICKWTEKKSTDDSLIRIENESELPEVIFDCVNNSNYPTISKERFLIDVNGSIWEIDFFDNYDFVIAELEFKNAKEANDFTDLPSWIITEVTDNPDYLNCNLAEFND